jgi:hypothetical protein
MTADLQEKYPLPEGWSELELVEDTIVADGVELLRAGVASCAPTGEEVIGAAAEGLASAAAPASRSYYELLERVAVIDAIRVRRHTYELLDATGKRVGECLGTEVFPESTEADTWRYARTNGVAIHGDWVTAAHRASCELAERDRLLRAWCGEIAPKRVAFDFTTSPLGDARHYDWQTYDFVESRRTHFSRDVHVAMVVGFPRLEDSPLVLGFGGRSTAFEARDAAVREAMQSLAFLWGEPIATTTPETGPTPMHHLDHFQYRPHHELIRTWLDGRHDAYARSSNRARPSNEGVVFVDLTPSWLAGGLRVAKALCASAVALAFGDAPMMAMLPQELRVHPIA